MQFDLARDSWQRTSAVQLKIPGPQGRVGSIPTPGTQVCGTVRDFDAWRLRSGPTRRRSIPAMRGLRACACREIRVLPDLKWRRRSGLPALSPRRSQRTLCRASAASTRDLASWKPASLNMATPGIPPVRHRRMKPALWMRAIPDPVLLMMMSSLKYLDLLGEYLT